MDELSDELSEVDSPTNFSWRAPDANKLTSDHHSLGLGFRV